MGLARAIAVRLGRFHNWNCPCFDGRDHAHLLVGRYGEDVAASWCRANGIRILRRNWKDGKNGELDLVCRDGETLVFIEVKTRTNTQYGSPARAVNKEKRDLIRSGARRWLMLLDRDDVEHRYDIIEVLLEQGQKPDVSHIPYAFWGKERSMR